MKEIGQGDYILRVERFEKSKHSHVRSILTGFGKYAVILESSPKEYSADVEETCRGIAKYLINAGIVEPGESFRLNPRKALEGVVE